MTTKEEILECLDECGLNHQLIWKDIHEFFNDQFVKMKKTNKPYLINEVYDLVVTSNSLCIYNEVTGENFRLRL